jgi:hypothetical protein
MANIGVTFDFAAESAKLRSEIDKVRKELGTLNSTAKGIGDGFVALGKSIAGIASVSLITSQLVSAGKAAIQFGDDIQKASAKTGIAASQFGVLANAAKLADIDMNSLSTALRKMQVAVSEAGSGSRAALSAFAALGIEFKEIQRIAPQEQFLLLADRINALESPADRVRAAVELFGRAGAELLPFFEQGAAGIRKATDEITRMGGALSDEQIQKLADADEAIKRLSSSWDNFARTLTATVAPALTAVLNRLVGNTPDQVSTDLALYLARLKELQDKAAAYSAPGYNKETLAFINSEIDALQKKIGTARLALAELNGDTSKGPQRRTNGTGSSIVPPGFSAPADPVKAATAAAAARTPAERDPASFTLALGRTSEVLTDPLLQPEYLLQQQLGVALLDLKYQQSADQMAVFDEANKLTLDSFLLNNDYMIAAEQAKNQTLGASIGELAGMALQQGGILGKFGKAYAIAQTVWSTGTAIMNALAQVPYPANLAAAAGIAVKGAVQLANIKKTNIGSGAGSVVGVGGGASGVTRSTPDGTQQASTESNQRSSVQIVVQGNLIETDTTARWLQEVFRDAVDNRDMVFFSANSRQALELGVA